MAYAIATAMIPKSKMVIMKIKVNKDKLYIIIPIDGVLSVS